MATSGAGQLLDGETEAQAAPPPAAPWEHRLVQMRSGTAAAHRRSPHSRQRTAAPTSWAAPGHGHSTDTGSASSCAHSPEKLPLHRIESNSKWQTGRGTMCSPPPRRRGPRAA